MAKRLDQTVRNGYRNKPSRVEVVVPNVDNVF